MSRVEEGALTEPANGSAVPYEEGQILAGKFRLRRMLGKGGMGYVMEAEHMHLDRRVAIKLLLPEHAKRSEWVTRFMREARTAATIPGEHVVEILDVATLEDATPYIVMELLEGLDLAQLIESDGALGVGEAVSYVLQACRAIAEAHSRGIVHRDLKPGNLFLTQTKEGSPLIKVFDFGISKLIHKKIDGLEGADLTSTMATMGSPYYMSPEQLRSAKSVDARSDIWSLGVIVHELVSGKTPFTGESLSGVCAAVVADPAIPVREQAPHVPEGLEQIILKCLQKDASKRYASVGEFAAAIAPFAEEPSGRAFRPTLPTDSVFTDVRAHTLADRIAHSSSSETDMLGSQGGVREFEDLGIGRGAELEPQIGPHSYSHGGGATTSRRMRPLPAARVDDDMEERTNVGVWVGIGLAAVLVLGGLGYVGYRARMGDSVDTRPTTSPGPAPSVSVAPGTSSRPSTGVVLELKVDPSSAVVTIDGEVVHERELHMPKSDAPRKLVVSAPGYKTSESEFTPSVGGTLVVTLTREGEKKGR